MGVIAPSAIRDFLEHPRDHHTWMKSLKHKELNRVLRDIGFQTARPDLPLSKHQKVCIILGVMFNTFAFWLDLGAGKTRIALELLRYWKQQGIIQTGLVTVISDANMIGWEDEIQKWTPDLTYTSLYKGSTQSKWSALAEFEGDLILATYAGLPRLVSKLKKPKNSKKPKRKLSNNRALLRRFASLIQAIVCDESTKIGNKKSITYRTLNKLAKFAPQRVALAGIPFGRDPTMMWSQLYFIDRGESLGDTLGIFRAALFDESENYWGAREYKFDPANKKIFNRLIQHRSITYQEKEYREPGKVVHKIEKVVLPEEATAYYQRYLKDLQRKGSSFRERKNAFIRMRQISSGFIGVLDDETGTKAEIAFHMNPKMERLTELLEDLPHRRKAVIFHEFIFSGKLISQTLDKMGIKHGWLWSGTEDTRLVLDRFNKDDDYPVLLANHKVAAYGGNYQRANYTFIYEAPVPVIDDAQMRKRVNRPGQTRTVYEYDLVCRGTVDQRILDFHQEGRDLFAELVLGKRPR